MIKHEISQDQAEELMAELKKEIEARAKTEQYLRESEAKFRTFFERAADAIFIAEADSGIIVDANQAASRLLQLPPDKIIGIHHSQLHPVEVSNYSQVGFDRHKHQTREKNSSRPIDNHVVRPDGSLIPVEILASEVTIEGKRCLMGTFRDITERKKAEEELKESVSLLNATLDSTADGILVVDKKGKVISYNKKFVDFWKITDEILGTLDDATILSFVLDQLNDPEHFLEKVKELYSNDNCISDDIVELKDGRTFERYSQAQVLDGECVGRVWSFRDITSKKLVEERYKSIFENAVEGLYQSTPEGKFLTANPSMARILGYDSPENLMSERTNINIQGYADPKGREDFMRKMEEFGSVTGYEYQAARLDGSSVWVTENARLMTNQNGKKYYEGSLVDITEHKQAEELLFQKTELLTIAEKIAQLGSWRLDLITRENSWSDQMFRIFGIRPDHLEGTIFDFFIKSIHPDDRQLVFEVTEATFRDGLSRPTTYRIVRADGEVRWVHADGKPQCDKNGRIIELIGTLQDITERKLAEMNLIAAKEKAEKIQVELQQKNKELTERNSFIQTVLDNLPIGIALNTINDGAAKYMNRKFEEIYGWSSAEITSIDSFFECVYPDPVYRNEIIEKVMADIQSGDLQRMHWENLVVTHKDGSCRWINAVNIPLPEQNTMVSTVYDITDLHQSKLELIAAKEKAEESDRLKSAFLANMSHEIRTPLNSIIGFSDLLNDSFYSADQQAEFATYIKENGNYLLAIISDIMDFSKIESGQVLIRKNKVSINKLLNRLYNEFRYRLKDKEIEFQISVPENDILLQTDDERLRQILINLVGNAVKFTNRGFVRIGAHACDGRIQFQVSDTGIGIQADFQEKIFERFWQVDSSKSRKYGGNGLGLTISKSLVELLGGQIWVDSTPNKGSVFYVELPTTD